VNKDNLGDKVDPVRLEITEDGSWTVRSKKFGVPYHSSKGAIKESRHVFIESGIAALPIPKGSSSSAIHLLEMGFGTGLNAWLAWEWARENKRSVGYFAVEAFPLSRLEINSLPAPAGVDPARWILFLKQVADQCHPPTPPSSHSPPSPHRLDAHFTLEISIKHWEDAPWGDRMFDVIFYDAFAPECQPELWSRAIFQTCYDLLRPDGIWVSYCAKGQVRRDLEGAGFVVDRLTGASGKREMLRGRKPPITRKTTRVYAVIMHPTRKAILLSHEHLPIRMSEGWYTKFPGGGQKPGESLEQCLWRELGEELAIHDADQFHALGPAWTAPGFVRSLVHPEAQVIAVYFPLRLRDEAAAARWGATWRAHEGAEKGMKLKWIEQEEWPQNGLSFATDQAAFNALVLHPIQR
jgi:tRNA U34 5-methylaminomethyl-2-thiouridine-forming methyltransferase MnmC/ADP-ribose pyrophosphatase YjhB (NUDIX family)